MTWIKKKQRRIVIFLMRIGVISMNIRNMDLRWGYRHLLLKIYFNKDFWIDSCEKEWKFIDGNWDEIIHKEYNNITSLKNFLKKHRLKIKLIKPPEDLL